MVLKFSCRLPRFLNMGISLLKKLLDEAKASSDVITIEATVITGFEFLALEECKQKCKPSNISRAKGRIFFNIKKDSYPEVLKMRSIDNVFLVSEAFEDLKFNNVKEDDLLIIKNLANSVKWEDSIPKWAEIVGFKGIQFPKCANKNRSGDVGDDEPLCQNCQQANAAKGGGDAQQIDPAKNEAIDVPVETSESCEISPFASDESPVNLTGSQSTPLIISELLKDEAATDADETNDEAFQSVEEKLEPRELTKQNSVDSGLNEDNEILESAATGLVVKVDDVPVQPGEESENRIADEVTQNGSEVKYQKGKGKWQKRKESRLKRNAPNNDVTVHGEHRSDEKEPDNQSSEQFSTDRDSSTLQNTTGEPKTRETGQRKERKKNYWQKSREAKARKAAEADKKKPRKPYVNDALMKFRVTCYRNGPKHSFESNDAAGHFGGLINDKLHWNVDLTRHDVNVVLVIEGDSAYVSMALTKQSLHRRNVKSFGPTTMRATLCYGLLQLAEPRTGDIIVDPMCGGGSISIEGALALPGTYNICGDFNTKCMERVADNVAHNSSEKPLIVDGLQWDVRRLPLRDQSVDVLVTDLPFGLRVGKQRDNTGLYTAALIETARVVCTVGRASLLTYDKTAMIRALQRTRHLWHELNCKMVNQGGLRCFVYLLLRKKTVPRTEQPSAPQAAEDSLQKPDEPPTPEGLPSESLESATESLESATEEAVKLLRDANIDEESLPRPGESPEGPQDSQIGLEDKSDDVKSSA